MSEVKRYKLNRYIPTMALVFMPEVVVSAADFDKLKAQLDELVKALEEAANSLRTISEKTGRDEYLENASDVRGYANSRYKVADEALSRIEVKI